MRCLLVFILALFMFPAGLFYAQPSYVDWLDSYVSIDELPRLLGVNLKFQPPKEWSEQHAHRPHIVKMYSSSNEWGTFRTFINNLLAIGATEALYLVMGAGWNHSWYRLEVKHDRSGPVVLSIL